MAEVAREPGFLAEAALETLVAREARFQDFDGKGLTVIPRGGVYPGEAALPEQLAKGKSTQYGARCRGICEVGQGVA
jgi:hypothetical protein